MSSHSLFHSAGRARCQTPWEKLRGDDTVRECPTCSCIFVRIDGLSEEDAAQVIRANRPEDASGPRLYRADNGTFTFDDRECHILSVPPSYVDDWKHSAALVVNVLARMPVLTAGLFITTLVSSVMWWTLQQAWLSTALYLTHEVLGAMLICALAQARACEVRQEQWQAQLPPARMIGRVLGLIVGIPFAGTFMGMFFLPVIILLCTRFCLVVPAAVVGDVNLISALSQSAAFTEGKLRLLFRYLFIPVVVLAIIFVVTTAGFWLLGLAVQPEHLRQVASAGLGGLLKLFLTLMMVPLTVNLYLKLEAPRLIPKDGD